MKLKIIQYLKENNIESYMCRICSQIVDKKHFDTEEHINKFNSVCKIKIDKSLKDSFLKIKCKFLDTRYNYIYTDLYFKKYIKELILKNIDINKFYKSFIVKKTILEFNHGKRDPAYISYKFDSNNILNDLLNIQYLEDPDYKDRNMKPYLIKNTATECDYKINKMQEDLDKINFKESGNSIYYILSSGVEFYITECQLLKGSNYNFEKIPKLFYNSKVISAIKNKDEKCFIYCYIRKFLNPVDKHQDRISLKDKQICKNLEEDFNFDNVKIKDLSKIENLLETNIYVYSCDKNLKNKLPVYKSDKNYEKFLDLLLYEEHYMNIRNISRFFYPDEKNKIFFCRNCCNKMYS